MNRNEERFAPPELMPSMDPKVPQFPTPPAAPQFSFPVPTEEVDIPTKGRFYPDGHPWKDKESVEIKFMTAREEEILNNKAYIKKGSVMDKLLEAILVEPVDVSTIYTGDKNALLKAARISAFGNDYTAPVICPNCLTLKNFPFDLNDVTNYTAEECQFNSDGTFEVKLPQSKAMVKCKLLTGKDESESSKMHQAKMAAIDKVIKDQSAQKKAKEDLENFSRIDQYKLFIVAVNGNSDRKYINAFIDSMLAKDSKFLRTEYRLHNPDIDMAYMYACPACENTVQVQIPITKDFFWGD